MVGVARGKVWAALPVLLLAVGCGGSTSVGGTGGSAGSGGGGGSAGTGGAAGSGGSSGTGGSSGGTLAASITNVQMSVGCMPVVPTDPVGGNFDVLYDNQNGTQSASATIQSARFVMKQGNNTLTWSFSVTPTGSGLIAAGQTKPVTHTKTAGSGTGQGPQTPCNYCGGTGTLEVTWQSGGKSFTRSAPPEHIICGL